MRTSKLPRAKLQINWKQCYTFIRKYIGQTWYLKDDSEGIENLKLTYNLSYLVFALKNDVNNLRKQRNVHNVYYQEK